MAVAIMEQTGTATLVTTHMYKQVHALQKPEAVRLRTRFELIADTGSALHSFDLFFAASNSSGP